MEMRYGLIGAGMMGQEHIRNIDLLPNARVAAFFEPDDGMRAIASGLVPDAIVCNSVADLLNQEAINCLLIVSPNYLHVRQLEEIASQRALPVLVEKPLFTDPADLDRLVQLRNGYPAPIWVAMEYRYMPPVAALIESADRVTGGVKMLTIREHRFPFLPKVGAWNRHNVNTGGTLVEKCCHFFDLMRHVMGCNPVRIMASGAQDVNHKDEISAGPAPDIWDNAYVIVDFENGARALLELCMFAEGSRFQEEITAVGPEGKIECLVPGPGRFWPAHLGDPPVAQVIVSPRQTKAPVAVPIPVDPRLLEAGDHNGSTFYQHERFARALRGEGKIEVGFDDGWWAAAMGMAAQQSALTGQAVKFSDVMLTPGRG
ncbi:MAG: Gfo/Idh/MocA family oxidoreductase [Albidovulum sp.]|uniref:Gfo/Idh/MocA family protein n=1 Tax=Albidovulum sp. TaxID=1872424 RepID=UPI003C8450B9